jgi:hypothetical protein
MIDSWVMSIIKRLVVLVSILLNLSVSADIYTANSIEEINNTLVGLLEKRNAQKTLTILPLEGFILKTVDPAFNAKDKKFQSIASKVIQKAKLSKQRYISELILTEYKQQLSDPKIIDFFKNLQQKNAPFMVVTSNLSGSFNSIPYLEVWTWAYLFEQGIDLSKSPIGSKQIIFNKEGEKVQGTYPTFYRGLLSCNSSQQQNSRQGIIAALLALNLKWVPDVVYIVDKDEQYIKSIEQQFKSIRNDVQVIGFVYAPEYDQSDQVTPQEFLKFWSGVIDKLNVVSRTETNKNKKDPYEQ